LILAIFSASAGLKIWISLSKSRPLPSMSSNSETQRSLQRPCFVVPLSDSSWEPPNLIPF
jgi:hypothetical protein